MNGQCCGHPIWMMSIWTLLLSGFCFMGGSGVKCSNQSSEAIPLYIGGMFVMTGDEWDGAGCLVAAELALEQINMRTDILPDYQLKMIWHDTQCSPGKASRALFGHVVNEPEKIIFLGPGCSASASLTAQASSYWNIITVLNSASSALLSDREKFPNVYRTVPLSLDTFINPMIWMMKEYGWRKVGTTQEGGDTFNKLIYTFMNKASQFDAEVVVEKVTQNGINQMEHLKNQQVRIIQSSLFEDNAREMFCQAYKIGFYGEDMFWVLPSWYREKWWLIDDDELDCNVEEMAEIVETSLAIGLDVSAFSPLNETTVSGLTPAEVLAAIKQRLEWPQYRGFTLNNYLAYTIDAVWAIGLMLNKSASTVQQKYGKCLEDFASSKDRFYDTFFDEMARTNFFGASGNITFSNGDRIGSTQISQLRGSCLTGWQLNSRFCYKFLSDVVISWQEAAVLCGQNNAKLASLTRSGDYETLTTLWKLVAKMHLKEWHISSDVPLRENSSKNSTDNQAKDISIRIVEERSFMTCPYVSFEGNGSLKEGNCDKKKPFICKYKADFSYVPIAVYTTQTDEMIWLDRIIWPGGEITKDGTTNTETITDQKEIFLSAYAHIILAFASACGIILCLLCAILLLRSRSSDATKGLDFTIIFSASTIFISVVFTKSELLQSLTDQQHIVFCAISECEVSIGVTMGVTALVGKMWLIYKATTLNAEQTTSYTRQVYGAIVMTLLVDEACLAFLSTLFPLQIERVMKDVEINATNPNHVTETYVTRCSHGDDIIPFLLLYADKIIIVVVGAFLTYEVKQASLTQIEDTQPVSASIYNVILFGTCGLILHFLLEDDPRGATIFCSMLVICCTTITLLILFFPKVKSNKRSPDGICHQPRDDVQRELMEENVRLKNDYEQLQQLVEVRHLSKKS